jgi:hypothetical protein
VLASELDMLEQTLGHGEEGPEPAGELQLIMMHCPCNGFQQQNIIPLSPTAAGTSQQPQLPIQKQPSALELENLAPAASPSTLSTPTTNMPEEPVTLTLLQQMREQLRLAQLHREQSHSPEGSVGTSEDSSPTSRQPSEHDKLGLAGSLHVSAPDEQQESSKQIPKAGHNAGGMVNTSTPHHGSKSKGRPPPSNRQSTTSTISTSTQRMRKPYTPTRRPVDLTPQEAALHDMYERDMLAKELLISRWVW